MSSERQGGSGGAALTVQAQPDRDLVADLQVTRIRRPDFSERAIG